MIKAFSRLILLITLPIVLLIYVEPFNPVQTIRLYLTEKYFVDTYKGTFFLLRRELKKYPETQWPSQFERLAEHFGYQLKLVRLEEIPDNQYEKEETPEDGFVYIEKEPQALMQQIPDSGWAIVMEMGITEKEEVTRAASGAAYMLESYFSELPESQWPVAFASIRKQSGIELELLTLKDVELNTGINKQSTLSGELKAKDESDREDNFESVKSLSDTNLSPEQRQTIEENRITWISKDNGDLIYYRIGQSNYVIQAGPLSTSNINTTMISSVVLILFIVVSIGVLSWLRPLWLDLKTLDEKALAFGNGQLDSRVKIKNSSIASRLGSSFNNMADSVQRLIHSNQELTNAVAHDLRTPLSRLRFAFEILESEKCSDEEKERYRKSIRSSINNLDYLINQTLIHSRYSRATDISHFEYSDLTETIANEVELFAFENEQLKFVFTADEPLQHTKQKADSRALMRALNNLLSNASRYAASIVTVSFLLKQSELYLIVEDDGPGISPEDYENVFQPFAQVGNEARDSASGHGLGLAIVHQIAKWHKGSVKADKSAHGGAKFEMSWPADIL